MFEAKLIKAVFKFSLLCSAFSEHLNSKIHKLGFISGTWVPDNAISRYVRLILIELIYYMVVPKALDDPFFQEPDPITIFCQNNEPNPITIFLWHLLYEMSHNPIGI